MNAFTPSAPWMHLDGRAHRPSGSHGTSTTLEKTRAVALLTLVSVVWLAPLSIAGGTRGINLVWECLYSPLVQGALLVVLMSVVERLAAPGPARTLALAGAAVAASVLAGIVEGITLPAIGVWTRKVPFLASFWANLGGLTMMAVCFVLIYDYRFRLRHRLRAINDMRLRRARLVRETVESQLQAMQARVDPRFLFDTMACVERIYEVDSARGDLLLDDLIAYLRATLPDLHTTTSTLHRELALGRAYVDIRSAVLDRKLSLDVDVAPGLGATAFPPMCIVPMLQFLLADAAGHEPVTLALTVGLQDSMLRIDAGIAGASKGASLEEAEALEAMRRRMQGLYGERTRLTVTSDAAAGRRVLLEIPHEPSDGPDRRG